MLTILDLEHYVDYLSGVKRGTAEPGMECKNEVHEKPFETSNFRFGRSGRCKKKKKKAQEND